MRLINLKDPEVRARKVARALKSLRALYTRTKGAMPFFVAGYQRSGITMLMDIFHLHPDVEVFDESFATEIYVNYRVRNLETVSKTLVRSRFRFACYDVISDSHIIKAFIDCFPEARIIWMYRTAADNAASHLQQFPHATRAVRLVSQGKTGGGWFAEGVSPAVAMKLRELASSADLTEFDFACLAWWARNSLYFELGLEHIPNVRLLQYEKMVQEPTGESHKLFNWLGLSWHKRACRFVHARSVGKNLTACNPAVKMLCSDLEEKLLQAGKIYDM